MEENMIICVSSPMDLDDALMAAWTQGLSEEEALQMKLCENQFMGFSFRNQMGKSANKQMVQELMRYHIWRPR